MVGPLVFQVSSRESAKLGINQRYELVQGFDVSLPPIKEKLSHVL
jgi:hypothetical protein